MMSEVLSEKLDLSGGGREAVLQEESIQDGKRPHED